MERLLQVVQRDAHDGRVEEGQEEDAAENGERDARRPRAPWQYRIGQAHLSSSARTISHPLPATIPVAVTQPQPARDR